MMGSPGLDAGGDMKYPADCYSPKFASDAYRGKVKFKIVWNVN